MTISIARSWKRYVSYFALLVAVGAISAAITFLTAGESALQYVTVSVAGIGFVVAAGGREAPAEVAGCALGLSVLLIRPAILGEAFGSVGYILVLTVIVSTGLKFFRGTALTARVVPLMIFLLWPTLMGQSGSQTNVLTFLLGPVLAYIAGSAIGFRRRARGAFLMISFALVMWQVAAYALSLATATFDIRTFDPASIGGRDWTYQVGVGGAITTGTGGIYPILGPRLTGPFGEPGVFACFIAMIAILDILFNRRMIFSRHLIYLAALVFTQSVAGIAAYIVGVLIYYACSSVTSQGRIRASLGTLSTFVLAGTAYLWGGVNLGTKAASNAGSVATRLSTGDMLSAWFTHPLGTGLGEGAQSGINLIQYSLALGPAVLLLGVLFYLLVPLVAGSWLSVLAGNVSLTIIVAFAQPPMLPLWVMLAGILAGHQATKMQAGSERVHGGLHGGAPAAAGLGFRRRLAIANHLEDAKELASDP